MAEPRTCGRPDEPPLGGDYLARTRDPAKRAQAIALPNTNKLANLHVSLLKTLGVDSGLGDSSGSLRELSAPEL